MMSIKRTIKELERNKEVFKSLLSDKNFEEYSWRPQPEKWSLLEIVCHLLDEEKEDFRARIEHTLEFPFKKMKPINPEGWVIERDYISKNYQETLNMFIKERHNSISWLNGLKEANWESIYLHPKLGNMSARLFLTNWLAHDYLHMRQIVRYQYQYLEDNSTANLGYAGGW